LGKTQTVAKHMYMSNQKPNLCTTRNHFRCFNKYNSGCLGSFTWESGERGESKRRESIGST